MGSLPGTTRSDAFGSDDLTKTRQLYTVISYYKTTSALYAYRGSAPKVIYIANARRLLRYE